MCVSAAAQPADVTPPRAIDLPAAAYPASGHGNADVVLELLVTRSGGVRESRVVEGEPPFADAALDAARSFRFSPAKRGDRTVEAKVRVRVAFVEPPAPAPTAEPAAPRAAATPAASGQVEEVLVRGVRPEPPHQAMAGSEVRQIPGSFGDAFRAIEALPGVIPIVSGLPYFLVRGAPPGDTGFFVDGVRVPALFHLGVGTAVIHPDLVDRVDLYSGTYPARFGRFTGGILSGEVLPFPDRPSLSVSLRLIDAEAMAAVPIDDGRGEVMVSGRYGYPGPLLQAVAAIIDPQAKVELQYWDYQVRARWRVTARDEIGAFGFGSFDLLASDTQSLGIQFHRVDLRWDHKTSHTGRLRLAFTVGYDELGASQTEQISDSAGGFSTTHTSVSKIRSGLFGLRTEWFDGIAPGADLRLGADAEFDPYDVAVPGLTPIGGLSNVTAEGGAGNNPLGTVNGPIPTFRSAYVNGFRQNDFNGSAYAELTWRPSPRVELLPGVRGDVFTSRYPGQTGRPFADAQARATVDPRLTARWHALPSLSIFSAVGVAHQPSNIPLPSPGLNFSQLSRGLQTSYQYSAGFDLTLPWAMSATVDGFVHDYTGLADYYDVCAPDLGTCVFDGRAIGLEVMIRRKLTEKITGWLSYTLSRVERDAIDSADFDHWIRRLSEFDRTHVLNAVFAMDLGNRWRAGARVEAYSGLPYNATSVVSDAPPNARGPAFVRLDVRLEKSWRAFGGTMTFVFEWLNALLQKEAIGTSCVAGATPASVACSPQKLPIPITFPSVGLEWRSGQ
jgi:TonB family protein